MDPMALIRHRANSQKIGTSEIDMSYLKPWYVDWLSDIRSMKNQ